MSDASFSHSLTRARTLQQELESLVVFYANFSAAFAELGPEIERRRKGEEQMRQLIAGMQSQLDAAFSEELSQRNNFAEAHGRYLPSSLCPRIQEPPTAYAVQPSSSVAPPTPPPATSEG